MRRGLMGALVCAALVVCGLAGAAGVSGGAGRVAAGADGGRNGAGGAQEAAVVEPSGAVAAPEAAVSREPGARDTGRRSVFMWSRLKTALGLGLFGVLFAWFAWKGRRGEVFLRRIAGIDAMEEAVGRATEMGAPVLYIPGVRYQQDLQTLTSLVVLGHVARHSAEYGVRLLVPTRWPVVMTMAQEVIRDAFMAAGSPEAFAAEDVRFLSNDQFAYCAAVNGIMVRDRPAANFFLGAFFAESLIMAETGFAGGALQIAGTASYTQIPFFIVSCDYVMIGEEYFAASAYLSRDPRAIAGIKAADWLKVCLIAYLAAGAVVATAGAMGGAGFAASCQAILEVLRQPELLFTGGR